jgi:hypothetical protein
LTRLWANWITLTGSVITTMAGMSILLYFIIDALAPSKNPYSSAFFVFALPALFVLGLLIIPVGLWIDRRRRKRAAAGESDPIVEAFEKALRDRTARKRILFLAVATTINLALLGFAGQQTIQYMDSPKFCGTSCHTVMQPEWHAYNRSPHSEVACVECHIGPGTGSYVKAKMNGVGQMWAMLTNSYHRPIATPVEHVRASKDTCEHCHSKRWAGNQLKLYPHYKTDEKNSPAFNAFVLHLGGQDPRSGKWQGIHSHTNPDMEIRYRPLDEKRTKIGEIQVFEKGRLTATYAAPGQKVAASEPRTMDCLDCHNRATHRFDAAPKDAIDRALHEGQLDLKVPFLAQVATDLLGRPDVPRPTAEAFFKKELVAAYHEKHPEVTLAGEPLDRTAHTLAELYKLNVYPEMKLAFGSYRSNATHAGTDDGACLRCHDNEHEAKLADGSTKKLSKDCDLCHERVAMDEDPSKLEDTLQLLLPKAD